MRRVLWVALALVVVAPLAVLASADAVLQMPAVRGRVAAAVERAAGHRTNLAEGAALSVAGLWRLHPVVEATGVEVLNPPGFSRPALATVRRVSAAVALWPLLERRAEVSDIKLDGVDALLERDSAGRGNWERARGPDGPAVATPAARAPWDVRVGKVVATDVSVALRNGATLVVPQLQIDPTAGRVSGTAVLNGVPFALEAAAGGADGVRVTGSGVVATLAPQPGGGFAARGQVADLSTLSALAGRALPPLRGVAFEAQADRAGGVSFDATAGGSDLGGGVRLAHATLSAPATQPARATAEGVVGALPVSMAVNLSRVPLDKEPVLVQALLLADGGAVSLEGSVALGGNNLDLTVSAHVPDLRHAWALAGFGLPMLTEVALGARIAAPPNGPGVLVRGLRVTSAQGDAGGDALVRWAPRPLLRGSLVSQGLDLDAMLAPQPVVSQPVAPQPVAPQPVAPQPVAPQPVAPVAGTVPAPPLASAPPRPLPFAALRAGDVDLRVTAGTVRWHGGDYRALQARVLLQDGRLRLDPAQVLTPGGTLEMRVVADAGAAPPTLNVVALAPGLEAAPLAAAFGMAGAAAGTVDLDMDLRGAGADWRAMLPTLDGHAGVALVNGEVENQVLLAVFGSALRAANLPGEAAGRSRVRCFALRFDAVAGHVDVKALALDAARARLDGEGSVNLVDGTVDLHLRPVLRLGGTGLAVPVHLTGPLAAPVPALERGAIAPGRVGLSILGGGAQPDLCGPALAVARGNRPGAAPQ